LPLNAFSAEPGPSTSGGSFHDVEMAESMAEADDEDDGEGYDSEGYGEEGDDGGGDGGGGDGGGGDGGEEDGGEGDGAGGFLSRLDFILFNEHDFDDIKSEDEYDVEDFIDEIMPETNKTDREQLRDFVITYGLTQYQTRGLLAVIRKIFDRDDIPLSPKTLLGLDNEVLDIRKVSPGEYLHIGIKKTLTIKDYPFLATDTEIIIDICIDGVPLVKSSRLCLWPILGAFVDKREYKPFVIGVYAGYGSPTSIGEFMEDFIKEVKELQTEFTIEGEKKDLIIRAFCCDAPARSFLAGVRYHTAKHGCTKCTQVGTYEKRRVVFQNQIVGSRDDQSYRDRRDPLHHAAYNQEKNSHPLEALEVGMVSQIPIEPMHLLDLGVMKKVMVLFNTNIGKSFFDSKQLLQQVEELLLSFKLFVPTEFNRKTRTLLELLRFKAVEFRLLDLYTGPVALKGNLNNRAYRSFMKFHFGVRILYTGENLDLAHKFFQSFVNDFGTIFPKESLSYNVHSLLHITEDVKKYGLESMSNYKFENFLGLLKTQLRSSSNILRQVHNTLALGKLTKSPSIPRKSSQFDQVTYSHKLPDNHCMLTNGSVIEITEVSSGYCKGRRYRSKGMSDFYEVKDYPEFVDHPGFAEIIKNLGVSVIDPQYMDERCVRFHIEKHVKCKLFLMPYQGKFVAMPLIHTV
jgi:hypothetical protein